MNRFFEVSFLSVSLLQKFHFIKKSIYSKIKLLHVLSLHRVLIKFIEYLWEVDSIRQNKYQGLFIVFKFVLNENNKREISVSLYLTEIKIV